VQICTVLSCKCMMLFFTFNSTVPCVHYHNHNNTSLKVIGIGITAIRCHIPVLHSNCFSIVYHFDNTVMYLPKFTCVTSHMHDLNKPAFESKKSVQTSSKSGQKLGFKPVLNKFDVMQFTQYTAQLRPVRSCTLIRHLYTVSVTKSVDA